MPDTFVSLAFALGGAHGTEPTRPLFPPPPVDAERPGDGLRPLSIQVAEEPVPAAHGALPRLDEVLRELTLLRLAACEAYARARARLVEGLARDVLGRELIMEDVALDALARSALARFADHEPLAVRVACGMARRLSLDIRVLEDATLEPGDLVVEVRDGVIDARFSLRLAALLESLA